MPDPSVHLAPTRRSRWFLLLAAIAIVFGLASVVAGGRVLFGPAAVRAAEGDYVPFVLWFNFVAGFAYVVAGVALGLARRWAAPLALSIAVATALVYGAFGLHVLVGGAYTMHTVKAMALRTTVWMVIAVLACRRFGCLRVKRGLGLAVTVVVIVIGGATCGRPADTVRVHAAGGPVGAQGRQAAPRMSIEDHRGQTLEVPAPGRVTVLSFASKSTADQGSARCRAVRVAHPDVVIVELLDVSSAPGLLSAKVRGKLAERHQALLADTRQAFAAVGKDPPADLDERIHIVADWGAEAFRAYGATGADDEAQLAVIDRDGGLVEFFASTPTDDALLAAVARAQQPPAASPDR